MCEYIPNTFAINIPEEEGWKELKAMLERCGAKEVHPPMYDVPIKPLLKLTEEQVLERYRRLGYKIT